MKRKLFGRELSICARLARFRGQLGAVIAATRRHSQRYWLRAAFVLLTSLTLQAAQAAIVTFSTTATQVCVGASGCGVAQQTLGGSVTLQFLPVASSTVNANPSTFASLGTLVVSCVGGGAACSSQSLAGLNVYINLAQTLPSAGFGSISGGVITGAISGTASSATITWSVPNTVSIGGIRYSIASNPSALSPPSTGGGQVTITTLITDATTSASPAMSYSPTAGSIITLTGGNFRVGTASIAVSGAGAFGSGQTTLSNCAVTGSGGSAFTTSLVPSNGLYNTSNTSGSIGLSCARPKVTAIVSLSCNETPGTTPGPIRTWTLVCPAMTTDGIDVDGDGSALPQTDGLLIVRYLLGFRGAALSSAAKPGAPRTDAIDLEAYLGALVP